MILFDTNLEKKKKTTFILHVADVPGRLMFVFAKQCLTIGRETRNKLNMDCSTPMQFNTQEEDFLLCHYQPDNISMLHSLCGGIWKSILGSQLVLLAIFVSGKFLEFLCWELLFAISLIASARESFGLSRVVLLYFLQKAM